MHHPTDRITHTTAFVTPVVEHWLEREIAQWVHHEGSIRQPIAPRQTSHEAEMSVQISVLNINLEISKNNFDYFQIEYFSRPYASVQKLF